MGLPILAGPPLTHAALVGDLAGLSPGEHLDPRYRIGQGGEPDARVLVAAYGNKAAYLGTCAPASPCFAIFAGLARAVYHPHASRRKLPHQKQWKAVGPTIDATKEDDLLRRLKYICTAVGISTIGVLAITIQRNRTTEFSSLIVNWDAMCILPNYPIEFLTDYKELKVASGTFLLCFKENLDASVFKDSSVTLRPANAPPFCCSEIKPYRPRRLDKDKYFDDFVKSHGTHDDVVYQVKEQIDNGSLLSTRYFKLQNGRRELILGAEFHNKVHAFKNYVCKRCKRFFGVDLYRADNSKGGNYHHMRLNPFTKLNRELLATFLSSF